MASRLNLLSYEKHLQSVDEGSTTVKESMADEKPLNIDKRLFAIPAWLDMIESVLKNIAVTMIAASIV